MDEPLVLAATVLAPLLLGFALRWKGAVLAALGLAGWAVARAADGGDAAELTGAAVLGAAGGLALGWAGALLRRGLRRRRRERRPER